MELKKSICGNLNKNQTAQGRTQYILHCSIFLSNSLRRCYNIPKNQSHNKKMIDSYSLKVNK